MRSVATFLSIYFISLSSFASSNDDVVPEWYWLMLEMYTYHDATVLMSVDKVVISGDEEYGFTPVIRVGQVKTVVGSSYPLAEGPLEFSDSLELSATNESFVGDYIVYLCFDEIENIWYKSEPFSIFRLSEEDDPRLKTLMRFSKLLTKNRNDKNEWCN